MKTIRQMRAALIQQALIETGGNVTKAAEVVGVSRGTLYNFTKQQPYYQKKIPIPVVEVGDFEAEVVAFETSLLQSAMTKNLGNQTKAAKSLKLPRHRFRYLWRKRCNKGEEE